LPGSCGGPDTWAVTGDISIRDHALWNRDETRCLSRSQPACPGIRIIFTCSTYDRTHSAVPRTCRQKTVSATALSDVRHAIHARNTVSRRSSGGALHRRLAGSHPACHDWSAWLLCLGSALLIRSHACLHDLHSRTSPQLSKVLSVYLATLTFSE
jgi:hypothetical protein